MNHFETIALYAITRFSEHTPKTALPVSIIEYILKVPPSATTNYAINTPEQKQNIPNLTPTKSIMTPPARVRKILGKENAE